MDKVEIGKRFTKFLDLLPIKQVDFAKRINATPQYIRHYATGSLNIQKIVDVLYELGCNLNWLFTGDGKMFACNDAGRELAKKYDPNYTEVKSNVGNVEASKMALIPSINELADMNKSEIDAWMREMEPVVNIFLLAKKLKEPQKDDVS